MTIGSPSYPVLFVLTAAMNPCPCGHLGDSRKRCRCTPRLIQRYRPKISGPLLDRIDLHIEVLPVAPPDLLDGGDGEGSAEVAEPVERARHLQLARTIPDLEASEIIGAAHVAEAIQYRGLDRARVDLISVPE